MMTTTTAMPPEIVHGTILFWLDDHSGFVVDPAGGIACPRCPQHGAMGVAVVRQIIHTEPTVRVVGEYSCLRCTTLSKTDLVRALLTDAAAA